MKIAVHPGEQLSLITEYMNFNRIPYDITDLYDLSESLIRIPESLIEDSNTLIIMDYCNINDFAECDISYESFVRYTANPTNKIWVFGNRDFLLQSLLRKQAIFEKLDDSLTHCNMTLYFESPPTDDSFLKQLKNIQVDSLPYNLHMEFPRIETAVTDKHNCKHTFLLTMIQKANRPQRNVLWNKLTSRPHVMDNSLAKFHTEHSVAEEISDSDWVGAKPVLCQRKWRQSYPSMDLYNSCWFEIVPETLCNFGNFITEKTTKPLATKTPFLVLANPGYLKFLQKNGFKTFDTLIDESYDSIPNLEERIDAMIDQVETIIENGAENFYRASLDILNHNQNRLLELSGRYQFDIDIFLAQQFAKIGF